MKLAKIFTDNMVFQAEKPVCFFGSGKGKVIITLNDVSYEQAFSDESWVMELPPQPYGGPYDITVCLQDEQILLKNVAFGDVFLCSGQSNMQFELREEVGANPVKTDEKIRYFCSDRIEAHDGIKSADGWLLCKEDEIRNWTALGAHIAEKYRENKDVFVGIVGCFQGASVIRSWMPQRKLDAEIYVPLEERHGDSRSEWFKLWNQDSQLYSFTFLPLVPFAFHSVVWYQGESNTYGKESILYTKMLARMIDAWREDLKDSALPFVIVEICDYDNRRDEAWYTVQRCQQEAAKIIKNVVTVTSKDVCEPFEIHPANKEELAKKIVAELL